MEEELSPERDGDKKWDEMTDAEKEVEGKVRGLRRYEWATEVTQ